MKKVILCASLLILASTHIVSASEGDQLPQSTMEGQTISSQLSSPETDLNDTLLPAPSDHQANDITKTQEDLSHEGITSAPQSKGFLQFLNIFNLFKTDKATQPQPAIPTSELAALKEPGTTSPPKENTIEAPQAVPDELTHQTLSSDIQGKSTFSFIKPDDTMPLQVPATGPNQGTGAAGLTSTSRTDGRKADFKNSSQTDPDDISHQSLATEPQGKGIMTIFGAGDTADDQPVPAQPYSVKGTSPSDTVQKNSRTLVAQAGTEDLSHQALAGAVVNKDRFYYIKTAGAVPIGDKSFRQFLDYGAAVSFGAGKHINENLSVSASLDIVMLTGNYSGRPLTTSSDSSKRIDVHTDLYIFPITLNALYQLQPIGKISPYAGGGLGYCMATRDSDSKAIKNKFISGPDYKVTLSKAQSSNGLLFNLLGGVNIPVYKKMNFVAEANATWYDLKGFDPILEISFTNPANTTGIAGNERIGVFNREFVGNFSVGLVMPF